jgi:hypothetical protein
MCPVEAARRYATWMQATLSSYALLGIDAVPVDVMVNGNQVKVVATRSQRVIHSVGLPSPAAGTSPIGSGVQGARRSLAPAYLMTTPRGRTDLQRGVGCLPRPSSQRRGRRKAQPEESNGNNTFPAVSSESIMRLSPE